MNQRAFWKYYRDVNLFNVMISVLSGIFFGIFSGLLIFVSFGILIGYLGFGIFRQNEYYLYYNLGFTQTYLLTKVWLFNLIFAGPLLIIYFFFL